MASFTADGQELLLTVTHPRDMVSIAISGTYAMNILFQSRKQGRQWTTHKVFNTANETVADRWQVKHFREEFRLVVDGYISGTATATLSATEEVFLPHLGINRADGFNLMQFNQLGPILPPPTTLDVQGIIDTSLATLVGGSGAWTGRTVQDMAGLTAVNRFWPAGTRAAWAILNNVVISTDGNHLEARISLDGSSLRTDATGYHYSGRFFDGSSSTNLNNNTNAFRVANAMGNAGSEVHGGQIWLNSLDGARYTTFQSLFSGSDQNSERTILNGGEFAIADDCLGFGVRQANGGAFTSGQMISFIME
jgi:hypothetical protein